ncbi:MAG: PD-(D/E)XK nuclease family protein [Thermoplasmata archaeon]
MGRPGAKEPGGRWSSASDLADYAYCPRSHYYRHHMPPGGPSASSVSASERGREFHAATLARVARRESSGGLWVALALASGVVLVGTVAALLLGGWGG